MLLVRWSKPQGATKFLTSRQKTQKNDAHVMIDITHLQVCLKKGFFLMYRSTRGGFEHKTPCYCMTHHSMGARRQGAGYNDFIAALVREPVSGHFPRLTFFSVRDKSKVFGGMGDTGEGRAFFKSVSLPPKNVHVQADTKITLLLSPSGVRLQLFPPQERALLRNDQIPW